MSFWNKIRKLAKIRFFAGLFLVGVLFVVSGGIALAQPKPEWISVEGTIDELQSYVDADGEEKTRVFVTYTDQNGAVYEHTEYPAYSSSMKEGNAVTVLYDPADPTYIQSPGGKTVLYVVMAAGVVALVVSVYKIVSVFRKRDTDSPFETQSEPLCTAASEDGSDRPGQEYYFHWTGKLNQSYVLETPSRRAVYEAVCDRMGVLRAYRYTFVDRRTGQSTAHKISHTVTSSYGDETAGVSIVSSSCFKIDGVNNWRYLAGLGYSVQPEQKGIRLNFRVLRGGVPVAYLQAAGVNLLKDDATNPPGDKLPAPGVYKVSCRDEDIPGVFWACFCVSRVEFY